MTAYNRRRALRGIVPDDLIEALGSGNIQVRREAIEELKMLAVAERDLIVRHSWVAQQPTYDALAAAFNAELRLYKADTQIWSQGAA